VESDAQKNDDCTNAISNTNACWTWINIFLIAFYHEHHSIPDIIFSFLAFLQ
jgi:hypothetical protein